MSNQQDEWWVRDYPVELSALIRGALPLLAEASWNEETRAALLASEWVKLSACMRFAADKIEELMER